MGSYYYIKDETSEFGYTPIPEGEYAVAILRIARKKGTTITDKQILKELEKKREERFSGAARARCLNRKEES